MKRSLFLTLVILSTSQAHASFWHNALKALTAIIALDQTAAYGKWVYQEIKNLDELKVPFAGRDKNTIILDDEKQALLQELTKSSAPLKKQLYFGVNFKGTETTAYRDANYINIDDRIFPWPDRQELVTIAEDEALLKAMDRETFKQCIDGHMGAIQHEMGHIVGNHPEKLVTYRPKAALTTGALAAGMTSYYTLKAFQAVSKRGTAGNLLAVVTVPPAIVLGGLYLIMQNRHITEYEADQYAIEHCTADQLEKLKEYIVQETNDFWEEFKEKYSLSEKSLSIVKALSEPFQTHPSPEKRAEILDQAIAPKKQGARL